MIGYVCKYTPVELLSALSAEPVRMASRAASFDRAEASMHPNMCSYVKGVYEEFASGAYEGLVLTTCCDSVRRLYDVLRERFPDRFLFLLDLPRSSSPAARALFADGVLELMESYRAFSGHEFKRECLVDLLVGQHAAAVGGPAAGRGGRRVRVGLLGARHDAALDRVLADAGLEVAFDLSCVGLVRDVGLDRAHAEQLDDAALVRAYASRLLDQVPCVRMADIEARERFLRQRIGQVDGLVCHTVKFCDIYSYEYARLHARADVPILKIETDVTRQSSGQIRTRVEAFAESLRAAKGIEGIIVRRRHEKGEKMHVLGIDSGSTSTNAAILDGDGKLVASEVIRTGARASDSAARIRGLVLAKAGLAPDDLDLTVSTGYGRVSVDFADLDVTEISCHGKGAWYFNPQIRTILDIGGQDSKAIRLDDNGEVAEFVMNDKCAAGTGRFLEAMARTLEVDIADLGPLSFESKRDVEISSMCTVFAESEVISLIADDVDKEDIAHGVHAAIAGKAFSLMKRVGLEPAYMMTGGVAKNPGVVAAVEELLGEKLWICEEPEIVGAVGAALFGLERLREADV